MTSRKLLSLAAAALFFLPASSFAQVYVGFGGAAPTGDFKEVAKTGWMAILGADFDLGESGAAIYGEGFYGENKHETEGDKTNPYGAMAGLLYNFSSNPDAVGVYVFGGGGLLVHKFSSSSEASDSESQFGYQAGAGVGVPLGGALSLFGEGRFMGSKDTTYFGFLAGLGIDFSGGN
jgi:hypothetical protein